MTGFDATDRRAARHVVRAVLRRAGGLCEGCLAAPATQVHHLTYQRVGDEMLFDLVAICESCHEKVTESERRRP